MLHQLYDEDLQPTNKPYSNSFKQWQQQLQKGKKSYQLSHASNSSILIRSLKL